MIGIATCASHKGEMSDGRGRREVDVRYDEQIIVAGAGPVGLWLAAELALAGVPTLVVERNEERGTYSSARGLHPRTIEILAMRGVEKRFLAEGAPVPGWYYMPHTRLDFRRLDTPFPSTVAYPQVHTEELLERHAMDLGVRILRGHAVTGLTQDVSSVTVEVEGPDGVSKRTVEYVVGCDGGGSVVREAAGIDFPGTEATSYGYFGEVVLDDPPEGPGASWHNDEGVLLVVPLSGGRFRLMGVDAATQDSEREFAPADLRAAVIRVAGTDFGMRDATCVSRFGNASRHAASYRAGRVLVAGDAAHVHVPAGATGLDVGLQDAMNLGWKLAAQVQGRSAGDLLDSYHRERHAVGAALVDHMNPLVTAAMPAEEAPRTLMGSLIASQPRLSLLLAEEMAALDVAYPPADPRAHPLAGTRLPDPGGPFDLLHEGRAILLDLAGAPLQAAAARASSMGIETYRSALARTGGPDWTGVGAAIIRPDGYVWWAEDETALDLQSAVIRGLEGLGATF